MTANSRALSEWTSLRPFTQKLNYWCSLFYLELPDPNAKNSSCVCKVVSSLNCAGNLLPTSMELLADLICMTGTMSFLTSVLISIYFELGQTRRVAEELHPDSHPESSFCQSLLNCFAYEGVMRVYTDNLCVGHNVKTRAWNYFQEGKKVPYLTQMLLEIIMCYELEEKNASGWSH